MDIAVFSKMTKETILMVLSVLSFMVRRNDTAPEALLTVTQTFGYATECVPSYIRTLMLIRCREYELTPPKIGVYLPVE
jgi:hypothetical protein